MEHPPLRPPPECFSQSYDSGEEEEAWAAIGRTVPPLPSDDAAAGSAPPAAAALDEHDIYLPATQSDADDAAASDIDSDCMDEEEFERWASQAGLDPAEKGAGAATARLTPASAHSPSPAAASGARSASSAGSSPMPHAAADARVSPHSPYAMEYGRSDDERDGASPLLLVEPSAPIDLMEDEEADADMAPQRGDEDWPPAFTPHAQQQPHFPLSQPRRVPIPVRTPSGSAPAAAAAAAASSFAHTAAASSRPVARVPAAAAGVSVPSRASSSFLAVPSSRIEDIENADEEQGDLPDTEDEGPDEIEFTPSPPATAKAANRAAKAAAPPRQPFNPPFKPPRPLVPPKPAPLTESADSIDLTDSPPPSPSKANWAEKFIQSQLMAASQATAASVKPGSQGAPALPASAAAAPPPRPGSLQALLKPASASASKPPPPPPRSAPPTATPSSAAAVAAAIADANLFQDMFDFPDSNTPHTAAVLSEQLEPYVAPPQRTNASFLQARQPLKLPTSARPATAATAVAASPFSSGPSLVVTSAAAPPKPAPARADAADVARLAQRRKQEEEDRAFVEEMLARERRENAAASGAPHSSPMKKQKVGEQPSIKRWLSPGKPKPDTPGSDVAAAASRPSSVSPALGERPVECPSKSFFTKQPLAHGSSLKRKLMGEPAPSWSASAAADAAALEEGYDDEGEAEYNLSSHENSRTNSPVFEWTRGDYSSSRPSYGAATASDLIPRSMAQLQRSMPAAAAGAGAGSHRGATASRGSKRKKSEETAKTNKLNQKKREELAARVARAPPMPGSAQSYPTRPPPTTDVEMSQLAAAPPPVPTSLRKLDVDAPKRTTSEMVRAYLQKQAEGGPSLTAHALAATSGPRGTKLLASAMTPAQRAANARQEAELLARKEKAARKLREQRRLQPSLAQLHADILTWDLREIGGSVARKLHEKLISIPRRFQDVEEYQSIMYPLLLEECRAGVEQQLEELRGAQQAIRDGAIMPSAGGGSSNRQQIDTNPVTALFSTLKQSQSGQITTVETDLRLQAMDAPAAATTAAAAAAAAASASASASATSSSRSDWRSDRNSGYQHDDLVILWQNTSRSLRHAAGSSDLFPDEEPEPGEIDPALLVREWQQAPFAILALLQDYENKHELNQADQATAANAAALAAASASTTGESAAARKDNPPFKLRMCFDNSDPTSVELKRALFSKSRTWLMLKLQNIKTLHREYSALQSCEVINLCEALIHPPTTVPAPKAVDPAASPPGGGESRANPATILAGISRSLTLPLMLTQIPRHIAQEFNAGQLRSIAAALMRREGFSLIQGPPGTGKTKTIVGLVNMLYLQHQAKRFLAGHADSYYKPPGASSSGALSAASTSPPLASRQMSTHSRSNLQRSGSGVGASKAFRLLICAPSNAAINEIVDRLEGSLRDFDGIVVPLKIVRLGAGANKERTRNAAAGHSALLPFHERVSLDNLVKEEKAARENGGGFPASDAGADGSLSLSRELLSTPLEALRRKAMEAVGKHRTLVEESNQIHARIKEITVLIQQSEKEEEMEALMVDAGQIPAAAGGSSAAPTAAGGARTRTAALEAELAQLEVRKRSVLQAKSEQQAVALRVQAREKAEKRTALSPMDSLRVDILQRAHIVATTLSGAGLEFFRNMKLTFSTVIVDESAQSSEIQTLIPLKYNVKRCILVGDPNQLSATVKSSVAIDFAYKQSLFQRLQLNCPEAVELLSMQYRMHWEIARWPSKAFYDGRLQTAPQLCAEILRAGHIALQPSPTAAGAAALKATSRRIDLRLGPYVVYDVQHGLESSGARSSLFNTAEADLAVHLLLFLRQQLRAQSPPGTSPASLCARIGLISPYQRQVLELRRKLERVLSTEEMRVLEIDSVDAFQGREKDYILFSCVRAQPPERSRQGIGFLAEFARLNVALTRARLGLFVLAHVATVSKDPTWATLASDARARHRILDVPRDAREMFRAPLWREGKWMREMEACPYTSAEMEAEEKGKGGAAPATGQRPAVPIAKPAVTTTATHPVPVAKSAPSTPSSVNAPASLKTAAPSPVASAGAATATATATPAAVPVAVAPKVVATPSSSLPPGMLAIAAPIKKMPPKGESALFANEQRTGIKRPVVPINIPTPGSSIRLTAAGAAGGARPVGKPIPVAGGLVPLKTTGAASAAAAAAAMRSAVQATKAASRPATAGTTAVPAPKTAPKAVAVAPARNPQPSPATKPAAASTPRPTTVAAPTAVASTGVAPTVSKRVLGPGPAPASSSATAAAARSPANTPRSPAAATATAARPKAAKKKAAPREKEEGECSSSSDSSSDSSDSDDDQPMLTRPARPAAHTKPRPIAGAAANTASRTGGNGTTRTQGPGPTPVKPQAATAHAPHRAATPVTHSARTAHASTTTPGVTPAPQVLPRPVTSVPVRTAPAR